MIAREILCTPKDLIGGSIEVQKSFNIENNKEQNGDTEVEAEGEEEDGEEDEEAADAEVIVEEEEEEEEEEEDDSDEDMSGEQVRVSNNIATSLAV